MAVAPARSAKAATIPPPGTRRAREALAAGRYRSAAARIDGAIVGVGTMSVGNDELVGVATAAEHRRRGIAAAVSHRLLSQHFALGGRVAWLSAADDAARRAYARIGFRLVVTKSTL